MPNGIFKLDWASIGDAALLAATGAVVALFVGLFQQGTFDVFTANWIVLGKQAVNVGLAAGILSIGKDFLSTSSGSLLGVTQPYTTQQ